MILAALTGPIIKGLFGIVDKVVEDKDVANKIKAAITERQQELMETELKGAIDIILAEAKGSSAQRNWRPHLMYLIMFLLVFNGVFVPLADAIFDFRLPVLEAWTALPDQMWTLLTTGLGGYIVGRSGEKMVKAWKNKE